jgi:hypothetical protein
MINFHMNNYVPNVNTSLVTTIKSKAIQHILTRSRRYLTSLKKWL